MESVKFPKRPLVRHHPPFGTDATARLLFVGRPMPGGTQVLVSQVVRSRTCRRLDGITKIAYGTRAEEKAARTKAP
jgi:uracil-DNA glycosylase